MSFKKLVQWQTKSGQKITVGNISLTPQSRALIIRWPSGGWVWNQPTTVTVERGDQQERFHIVDLTRRLQLICLGLSLLFSIGTLILSVRQRRHQHESRL